jgi:hypothetical protein
MNLETRYGVNEPLTPEQLDWAYCTHYIGKGEPVEGSDEWKAVKVRPRPTTPEARARVHLTEYKRSTK